VPEHGPALQEEVRALTGRPYQPFQADLDAVYASVIELDASGLGPQIAEPPSPTQVKEVAALKGLPIDSGFIGSCTNGRTEDFVAAARILKGRRVKPGVMLKVVPATRRVYEELLGQGILRALFEAGAIIINPGCGGCAEGHAGLTGKGEVQVSTSNRNFPGKQGQGSTYLASPEVVAASSVLGAVAGPEDVP
ncbi:MAG: aconitase family protein, partial [Candidatus Aminicenantales bacterium]